MNAIISFTEEHRWLSNFWEFPDYVSPVDGFRYPSVEHAYHGAKWDAYNYKRQIAACPTPGHAKRMGSQMPAPGNWDQKKTIIMHALLRRKFEPGRSVDLTARLIATGNAMLIEGNTWGDTFWGRKLLPSGKVGAGRNILGLILMEVRDELNGATPRTLPRV